MTKKIFMITLERSFTFKTF